MADQDFIDAVMDDPEFISGTKAAHDYIRARLGSLASSFETFKCYTTPTWAQERFGSIPEGYPRSRKVPGRRSAVFVRSELDAWCKRVLTAVDPDCETERHRDFRARSTGL